MDDFARKTNPLKIFPASLVQPVSNPNSEIHVRRAPLPHGYLSNFVDFKPIHENDNQVLIDLTPHKHKFDGYTYSIPDSKDVRIPIGEPKKYVPYYPSDDLVKALLTLDKALKPLLDTDSYNSALHPPLNPVLALVLSRYGKYISSKSRLYSYTATNNMHNNRPFGQYKYECDENPVFVK
ncbi:hypothetical protein TKK_0008374 [Trichogramma kaykai]|uniref:Uncharacterized protein n=1 Tax=Trichogramma kaykai TaxID=54128 RepID=A0ABD2X4S9_9HYME